MLRLAFRNILRHRFRTLITAAAIVFGVIGLVLSGGFVRDTYVQLGEALIHSQSGHLQVARSGYFTYGSRSPEKFLIKNADALRERIAAWPEVDDVMARLHFSGLLNNGRTDWPIVGEGVEPERELTLSSFMRIVAGRQLRAQDSFGILVGDGVAKSLKLNPGDHVTLVANTLAGAVNSIDFDVVGVFQSFSKDFDARAVRIPLTAALQLLDTQGMNTLVISLKRTEDTNRIRDRISAALDATRFEVRTWTQLNDFYEKTIALYEQQFGFLQTIILVMVFLSVTNTVNMSVFERVGEFGTMMALGNDIGTVRVLIITECALLGLGAAIIGTLLGTTLAVLISAVGIPMPPPPNANIGYVAHIRIVPGVLARAFAVGVGASVLASLIPAIRIARLTVVDALRANL